MTSWSTYSTPKLLSIPSRASSNATLAPRADSFFTSQSASSTERCRRTGCQPASESIILHCCHSHHCHCPRPWWAHSRSYMLAEAYYRRHISASRPCIGSSFGDNFDRLDGRASTPARQTCSSDVVVLADMKTLWSARSTASIM